MDLRTLRPSSSSTVRRLEERVADLEADLAEMRQHQLRLAELADVVQELLVPVAQQDREAVDAAVERFRKSL
ncbi:DUF6752 domain-containing protein [Nocardioides aestuarii]|uniref:DUF6752 domain-containing protein n=1 Tax=Nocardioides aestuarii TaxID=252231 RepID=A0ABW4TRM6_9ACTN